MRSVDLLRVSKPDRHGAGPCVGFIRFCCLSVSESDSIRIGDETCRQHRDETVGDRRLGGCAELTKVQIIWKGKRKLLSSKSEDQRVTNRIFRSIT